MANEWLARTHPEPSMAPVSLELRSGSQVTTLLRPAALRRRTSGRRQGTPSRPERMDARARLSPHWPRRARGRGRDRARARAEREAAAAAAPDGRARRGREPPRARRGHARGRPGHTPGCGELRRRPGGQGSHSADSAPASSLGTLALTAAPGPLTSRLPGIGRGRAREEGKGPRCLSVDVVSLTPLQRKKGRSLGACLSRAVEMARGGERARSPGTNYLASLWSQDLVRRRRGDVVGVSTADVCSCPKERLYQPVRVGRPCATRCPSRCLLLIDIFRKGY